MKPRHEWKPGNRLDNILNVLLIVLALAVLGVGALEVEVGAAQAASADGQRA